MASSCILLACFIFMTFEFVDAQSLVSKNGVELSYTAFTNNSLFTDDQRLEILFVGEIEDCVIECGMRNYCNHVAYHVKMHSCELFKLGTGEMIQNNRTVWIHVSRHNITIQNLPVPCASCPNKTACDWRSVPPKCIHKECVEFPPIENGKVLGNLRRIGSKIRFKCNYRWKPDRLISSVCLENGTWDAAVTCLKWIPLGDECSNKSCSDNNAECSTDNTCQCRDTYFQHGTVCLKKAALNEACKNSSANEYCLDDNAECSEDKTSSSGFKCKCKDSYFQNGQKCEPKASLGEDCTFASDSCLDDNARCTVNGTGFTCKCRSNYCQDKSDNCVEKIPVGQSCRHVDTDEACLDNNARCDGNITDKICYCKFQYEYDNDSKKCIKVCDQYSNKTAEFTNKTSNAVIKDIKFDEREGKTLQECADFCGADFPKYLSINHYGNKHCVCNKVSLRQYNKTAEEMPKDNATVYDRKCEKLP